MTVLRPAPPSPLNVEIGSHRRVAFVPTKLDDFKAVKNAFGGTVNDVVLAVTAGALRHLDARPRHQTEGMELRAARPGVDPLRRRPRRARQPAHAARRAAAGRSNT